MYDDVAVVSQEMVQVREDVCKEKAVVIEEKDKQDGRLKEIEQRLEQVCYVVCVLWKFMLFLACIVLFASNLSVYGVICCNAMYRITKEVMRLCCYAVLRAYTCTSNKPLQKYFLICL